MNLNNILHKKLQYLCKHEINNIEFTSEVFDNFIKGLGSKSVTKISNSNFDSGVILICFYNNFENFSKLWMEHYINLGIKNFVLIDNNSTDKSTSIIKKYNNKVNLELWSVSDNYNCYKMCGWRQQILEHYGHSKTYLFVDSDELFVYRDYKTMPISEFIKSKRLKSSKSLMLDVYSEKGVEDENLANYKYVDKDTYKKTVCVFGERFYGGFRNRVFGIKPSLQKISLLYYTGNEILFNDHYCYPWSINSKSKLQSFLIHYKFLKGDVNKYKEFAIDGRHWNNSREYKVYVNKLNSCDNFYDEDNALDIDNVIELFS